MKSAESLLVTRKSGFIGSHLIGALNDRGHKVATLATGRRVDSLVRAGDVHDWQVGLQQIQEGLVDMTELSLNAVLRITLGTGR